MTVAPCLWQGPERRLASAAIRKHADARAADILPAIRTLQESGHRSLHTIAAGLNAQGIPTPRGRQVEGRAGGARAQAGMIQCPTAGAAAW